MNTNSGYFAPSGSEFNNNNLTEQYLLTFTKEPAHAYRYFFGYIDYNLNRLIYKPDGSQECTKGRLNSAIYARFLPYTKSETKSFLRKNSEQVLSFYSRNIDLQTVDTFWRTGVFGCKMSGDLGPKFNERIRLQC